MLPRNSNSRCEFFVVTGPIIIGRLHKKTSHYLHPLVTCCMLINLSRALKTRNWDFFITWKFKFTYLVRLFWKKSLVLLRAAQSLLRMSPKWFWTVQINFGRVPIDLYRSNSFWSGPNHFGQTQVIKISPEKSNWTW